MYSDDADCRMVVQSAVGNSDVNGSMITNTVQLGVKDGSGWDGGR